MAVLLQSETFNDDFIIKMLKLLNIYDIMIFNIKKQKNITTAEAETNFIDKLHNAQLGEKNTVIETLFAWNETEEKFSYWIKIRNEIYYLENDMPENTFYREELQLKIIELKNRYPNKKIIIRYAKKKNDKYFIYEDDIENISTENNFLVTYKVKD